MVVSGDTRFNENVIVHGLGADLLIHEVAIARPELTTEAYIERIMAHHTTAREAGTVFARTRPKLAVYTHLVFLASKEVPPATVADLVAETRQTYSGRRSGLDARGVSSVTSRARSGLGYRTASSPELYSHVASTRPTYDST